MATDMAEKGNKDYDISAPVFFAEKYDCICINNSSFAMTKKSNDD